MENTKAYLQVAALLHGSHRSLDQPLQALQLAWDPLALPALVQLEKVAQHICTGQTLVDT